MWTSRRTPSGFGADGEGRRMVDGRTVALLGGGRMGEALVSGLIRSGGRSADEIVVTTRREERAREFLERYGVSATISNPEAVGRAEVLVLMVKPQDMEVLLQQIAPIAVRYAFRASTACAAVCTFSPR